MGRPQHFVDVTNFLLSPRMTGIERQLWAFANNRDVSGIRPIALGHDGHFVHVHDDFWDFVNDVASARVPAALERLHGAFHSDSLASAYFKSVAERMRSGVGEVSEAELSESRTALISYVFDSPRIDIYERIQRANPAAVVPLVVDFIIWTHPEVVYRAYAGSMEYSGTDRYLQFLGRCQHLVFTSSEVLEVFRRNFSPGWDGVTSFAYPGADAVLHTASPESSQTVATSQQADRRGCAVAVVGTIEVRRPWESILEAVNIVRRSRAIDLTFAGHLSATMSWEDQQGFRDAMTATGNTWIESPSDAELQELLRWSDALVYLSRVEGYGVPPLEALHAGVPVVVSGTVPSVQGIESRVVELVDNTSPAVAAALSRILSLSGEDRALAFRALQLPTWRDYVVAWASALEQPLPDEVGSAGNSKLCSSVMQVLQRFDRAQPLDEGLQRLSRLTLGRPLQPHELQDWTSAVQRNAVSPLEVFSAFVQADEAVAARDQQGEVAVSVSSEVVPKGYDRVLLPSWYGHESDETWVAACFQELLGRGPSASDVAEYIKVASRSRADVSVALVTSTEHVEQRGGSEAFAACIDFLRSERL